MSDLKLDESSLDEAFELLPQIANSLKSLSVGISAIDLSGIGIGMDFGKTVSLINDAISSNYSDSSIEVLRQNIEDTRASLRRMNSNIGTLFEEIDDYPLDEFGNFSNFIEEINKDSNNFILEEYLKKNFVDFIELQNGGYRVKNADGQTFYFSEDCAGCDDVKFVAYYPPSIKDDNTQSICDIIESSAIPSGTVVALSYGPTDGRCMPGCSYRCIYDTSVFARYDSIASDLEIKTSSVQTIGFSSGGLYAMPFLRMDEYLELHSEITNSSIVVVDGGEFPGRLFTDEMPCKTLVEKKVPVYLVSSGGQQGSGAKYADYNVVAAKKLSENGLDTYILSHNDFIDHGTMNKKLFSSSLYRFLSGETEQLNNINPSDYTVYLYNNGNYSIVEDFFVKTEKVTTPVQEPTTPVQEPTTPVQEPTTPVQEPTTPVQKPTTPVQKPTTPVQKPTTPVQEPTTPVQKPTTPVQEPTTPVQEPTTPVQKPTTPVQEPTAPVQEPTTPVQKPTTPVQKPTTPVQEPTTPVEENIIDIDNNDFNGNSNNKKYVLPGLLGTAITALIVKIGSIIKKKKKDNEDDEI